MMYKNESKHCVILSIGKKKQQKERFVIFVTKLGVFDETQTADA